MALADDAYNRSGLLESKAGIYTWLDEVDTSAMSAEEKATFDQLKPAWDTYFTWDDQVVEWLSAGTAEGNTTAMDSINGGDAGAGYGIIIGLADEIQASARDRAADLRAEQDDAQHDRHRAARRGRWSRRRPRRAARGAGGPFRRGAAASGAGSPSTRRVAVI